MKISVVGAAGYAGGELLRILLQHPEVRECTATSRSQSGRSLGEVHPGLAAWSDVRFSGLTPAEAARGRDVVFLALEHGESSKVVGEVFQQHPGLVVDLAADFRVRNIPLYESYYGTHPAAEHQSSFTYGLADVLGARLHGVKAIAVPGCFATAAQLALHPFAESGAIVAPALFAITGSSGSGAQPKPSTHHPTRANNVVAYSVLSHRHEAEILEQWRGWTGQADARVRLMTHSGPFVRGIYLTLWAERERGQKADRRSSKALFAAAYTDRPFVRLLDHPPDLTHVIGSNMALISVAESDDRNDVQVCVAIDNLIKGAGGQAVQAMNLALGLPEESGLRLGGMFPY